MILAIDGASTDLSVALATPDGEPVAGTAWSSAQRQSAELLPRVIDLLATSGRTLDEISAVAVGTGPGSFTGLRVAMALGKGLAFGLGTAIVGVPSLEAWLVGQPDAVAAVARAGAREAYVLVRGEPAVRLVGAKELGEIVSDGPIVAPTAVLDAFGLSDARPPDAAPAIAAIAARRLRGDGVGDDLATIEPIYLRAPRGVTSVSEEPVRWL
jgi:tRNA threonylcarbamoyl adenosine modification protein YeaZ